MGAGVVLRQPVRSVKELREENVVIQRLDYSCGSAALATIFSYYFGDPVSEPEVIEYPKSPPSADELDRLNTASQIPLPSPYNFIAKYTRRRDAE